MAKVTLTNALRDEYQMLFDQCQPAPAKIAEVEQLTFKLMGNRGKYESAGGPLGIPWYVVAALHNMESSQNFTRHLHNGDPLTARTVQVPKNRPLSGNPPFSWEFSATDALRSHGLDKWSDWSVPGMLYAMEGYNGWGYRLFHAHVKSPYLWGASNIYSSGKYVADGTWSETAKSSQVGCAVLVRRLAEKQEVEAEAHVPDDSLAKAMAKSASLFKYAPSKVTPGGAELQAFLNTFPDIYLKVDGKLGDRSSEACKKVFGFYLAGDPRA